MCALHMHIERTERQASQTLSLSTPVASLLQCCADSAQTILQTLQNLADDDLIGKYSTLEAREPPLTSHSHRCILTIPNRRCFVIRLRPLSNPRNRSLPYLQRYLVRQSKMRPGQTHRQGEPGRTAPEAGAQAAGTNSGPDHAYICSYRTGSDRSRRGDWAGRTYLCLGPGRRGGRV